MPSLPNISGYGQGVTNINFKDLDVVTLGADLVSTTDLVVNDIPYSTTLADIASIHTDVTDLQTKTRYITSTVTDETDISGSLNVDSNTLVVDAPNNKVGINIVSPSYPLSVVDSGSAVYLPVASFYGPNNTTAGNNTMIKIGVNENAGNCCNYRFYYAGDNSANNRYSVSFQSSTTDILNITAGEKVGILTTSPAHALDVNGAVNISTGNPYRINGTAVLSSNTLGASVTTSYLTSVGAAGTGVSIPSGTSYKIGGTAVISSTGLGSAVVDSSLTSIGQQTNGVDVGALQGYKVGGVQVLNSTTLGPGVVTSSLTSIGQQASGIDIATGQAYKINGVNKLTATALDATVTGSSLTSIGQQAAGVDIATGQAYKINGVNKLTATALDATVTGSSLTSIGTQTSGVNIASGQTYKINNVAMLSSTALGSTIVTSSLTSVGVLTTLNITAGGLSYYPGSFNFTGNTTLSFASHPSGSLITVTGTASSITITLPAAGSRGGYTYYVFNNMSGPISTLTLATSSSQLINNPSVGWVSTVNFAKTYTGTVICDGANWVLN